MKRFYSLLTLFSIVFQLNTFAQNPPSYEARKEAFIDSSLANPNNNTFVLQAFRGQTVDQQSLDNIYNRMTTKSTIDFDIVQLVRVLFLTNANNDTSYNSEILNALSQVPFWLTKSDTLRGYWSENHMIQWMSSDWLLHESYGKTSDANLRNRIEHYLDLKIRYGFYEFFSSTYMGYSLGGLINLADFSQDAVIKTKAKQAVERLLKDLLKLTNDEGAYFPAAGRNYYGKYENPYNQNHYSLVYLLTGFGPGTVEVSHSGASLATSSIDLNSVINSWQADIDTIYKIGHSIDSVRIIHQNQAHLDRMMFQWSSGCYFHPNFALESATLLGDSNIWAHVDFEQLSILKGVSPPLAQSLAEQLSSISSSTVICGQDLAIFKNNSVTLSSIQDFWKGKLGYQQFPVCANIKNTAVFPSSGEVVQDWEQKPSSNANDHLPYVEQNSNVALIMYRGKEKFQLFGETIADVSLHWFENDFDETLTQGNWLLGRVDDSYVAVRRHCTDTKLGLYSCDQRDGQTWVIAVGNDSMYGSFNDFQAVVSQSQFEEEWYFDEQSSEWVYHAAIDFEGKDIDYDWRDSVRFTSLDEVEIAEVNISVYPNPANNIVNIDFSNTELENLSLSVYNNLGQEIFSKQFIERNKLKLNTSNWNQGIYFINIVDSKSQLSLTKKLVLTK